MKTFIASLLIMASLAFGSQGQQEVKQIGPQEAGRIAFINEVNQTVAETGMTVAQAKEIVWREWENGSGEHYQDIIIERWVWKSWYGYATLFAGGCAIGYMCM